jgi:antitoxin YefM
MRQLSITEARQLLTTLPDELDPDDGAVTVTRRGRPVLALMPWGLYEALVETLEVLGDADLMEALRRSLAQADSGQLQAWDEVKAELAS